MFHKRPQRFGSEILKNCPGNGINLVEVKVLGVQIR